MSLVSVQADPFQDSVKFVAKLDGLKGFDARIKGNTYSSSIVGPKDIEIESNSIKQVQVNDMAPWRILSYDIESLPRKIQGKKNKYMFIPETNISVNHTMVINNVWPRSGCEIKRSITGKRTMPLNKYL